MLAQTLLSAAKLRITERERAALVLTLQYMETGRLVHAPVTDDNKEILPSSEFTGHFNMDMWNSAEKCGTVACIGGTAEMLGRLQHRSFADTVRPGSSLYHLLYPPTLIDYAEITVEQAARALRSYLSTGKPNWEEALRT